MIVYSLDRLRGLSEGVVSDVRLHEQPTGLNPVQRASLYAKKLTWSSKLKPPHSFITATSSASLAIVRHKLGSSSERKGVHMFFVNNSIYMYMCLFIIGPDQAYQSSTVSSSLAPPSHVTDIVDHVINNVAKLRSVQCVVQTSGP